MTLEPRREESVSVSPVSVGKVKSGAGKPSSTGKRSSVRRAVGVVRVSRVGARAGERFVSPSEQTERIRAACKRDGLKLVDVFEELDVSGGAPLERRPGLLRAVEMVETGQAEVVVVAFLDRLVRSVSVQAEVVGRVEQAGGGILAVDVGEVTHGSASKWLSGTLLAAVAEHGRRTTAERTEEAKRRAVADGVPPFDRVPPGYFRRAGADGRKYAREPLSVDPKAAPVVLEAFKLRAGGATVAEVREHLRAHGIERSYHGTGALLESRIVLGELRFGDKINESAHPAIVDVETWGRVQRMKLPRGRRAKSERLLARLGVLRCATCDSRLVVGSANHGQYILYRCPPTGDCPRRVTISAELVEGVVVDEVKRLLRGVVGTASVDAGIAEAERDAERAESELNAAVEAFSGLDDVAAAQEKLRALRDERERARDRLDELRDLVAPAITVSAHDWDLLTLAEQRDLIRAVVDRVVVAPGRGADRVTIEPRL